ncbi:MAG: hypothetical protein IJI22_03605 [Bacilli bacterium]|nr:hypothetical protein [Bacilli bacterium]
MKKVLRFIWSFVEVIIIIYAIILTSFILSRNKYGYTQFGDYTFYNVSLIGETNIDNVKKGDLLIVKNSNDINKGDLIYYYAVFDENYLIKSDVVLDVKKEDLTALYTVDDGSNLTVSSNKVLGKYSSVYPKWGSVLTVLESRIGFLFLVLLPIIIVFIYQIYEFVIILRYEKVEDDEDDGSDKKLYDLKKTTSNYIKQEEPEKAEEPVIEKVVEEFDDNPVKEEVESLESDNKKEEEEIEIL